MVPLEGSVMLVLQRSTAMLDLVLGMKGTVDMSRGEELEKGSQELNNAVRLLEEAATGLMMQNKELVSQVEMMRGENESLEHQILELELKLKNKDEDGSSSKPSFMNKPRLSSLAKYVPTMKSGIDKAQYDQKCAELEESQTANETLKEELEDKTSELNEAQEELNKVTKELGRMQEEFQKLKDEEEKNRAELEAMLGKMASMAPPEKVDAEVQCERAGEDFEGMNQKQGSLNDKDSASRNGDDEEQKNAKAASSRAQRDAQELKMKRKEAEHNHRLLRKVRTFVWEEEEEEEEVVVVVEDEEEHNDDDDDDDDDDDNDYHDDDDDDNLMEQDD
ncbi:hypothetical protein GUITHDRAFT_116542 [Guillardia theta CCMP2712]|uniref:Uncharacterized protein n=1 Tax=Guillardia theta (strain CCMP2712) TaxID=905079 RepID=L1IMH3_GUITC|nr:hypothetical protein GUITHDRAFT_116542 [Guillardia theta CCMP2712]EKX37272.1 hypothetical protein GUITHDRAFT_116542 [Guillardia theta CCMP2712]|eukprot:XP_005824252.1 hypothetical protein GUITHDRAFT_116542 [Guillardia theta CCMP2712]